MTITPTMMTLRLLVSALLLLLLTIVNAETLSSGEDVDTYVQKKIAGADVMVFAKSYCPYCRHTKKLLGEVAPSELSVDVVELDQMEDGPLIQMELMTTTGQRTVPNIFIKGKHIGGDSELTQLKESGELETIFFDMLANQEI
jgi:glutaredoxin